jgi:hypothetical protein
MILRLSLKDLAIIQDKLKSIISNLLKSENFDNLSDNIKVYNNYFMQFKNIIEDKKKDLTVDEKELILEVIDLNKKLRSFFESKKSEVEELIAKKGLKRKMLDLYNPYFKEEKFLKKV